MGVPLPAVDRGPLGRALDAIERFGDRLPDPLTLFALLSLGVVVASSLASLAGVAAIHPGTGQPLLPVNLLSAAGLRRILTEAVKNFAAFPPLGTVLVATLGIGVAERSGLVSTGLRQLMRVVPGPLLTATVVFAGVNSCLVADAGFVVLVPLGATLFAGAKRNPIAGLMAAFAGVSGAFGANLLVTTLDTLLAGITEPAARIVEPGYLVAATCNWYFNIASAGLLTVVGTLVTERIVEPRLGPWTPPAELVLGDPGVVTPRERKALVVALLVMGLTALVLVALVVPDHAPLRDDANTIKPLYDSLVALILVFFFVPGVIYGALAGTLRSDKDVARMSAEVLGTMGGYVVLAFAAAQFVAWFNWSNLGLLVAVKGAAALKAVGLTGLPLLTAFVGVSALVNLLIASASAKWAIMAPVFVPMLMLMGHSPETIQAAYRVGDAATNIVTPLMPYFPLLIVYAQKYDPKVGLGTFLSAMLPYSLAFLLCWTALFIVWIAAGVPLGPGAPLVYLPGH